MRLSIIFSTVILTITTSFSVFAQYNFPLVEIEKLTNKNASDFETGLLEKDYSLDTKASTPILKVYTSDQHAANGKQNIFTRYQVPNAVPKLEFSTTDKKYYIDVKSKLASMGFKFLKEEDKTMNGVQATVYNYTNGPFQLSLATYTKDVMWFVVTMYGN